MWELVEQDRSLGRFILRGVAERLPHVHHGKRDFSALFGAQPIEERRHGGFRTIRSAEPDRPLAIQVADHDAIAVALAHRDLVDADRSRTRRASSLKLSPHVLHLQRLDRVPVELEFLGDIADRCLPAAATDIERKAFSEVRIVRQKVQPFALHGAAAAACDAPHFEFQKNPKSGARQVANQPHPPVVPPCLNPPATIAHRFFERRSRCTIRTLGSPNTPRAVALASLIWPSLTMPKSSDSRRSGNPLSTGLSAAMIPQVGSRTGAPVRPRPSVHTTFPAPSTSHAACGFPALRAPIRGNALKRGRIDYDEATTLSRFVGIGAGFTREFIRSWQGLGNRSAVPIFIVGMPRSGTTLIEQILASHPLVYGGGELNEFPRAVTDIAISIGDPSSALSANRLRRLATRYLLGIRGLAPLGRTHHRQIAVQLPLRRPDPSRAAERAHHSQRSRSARYLHIVLFHPVHRCEPALQL
jgi:hypothetical protein